jgi:hypothetical protein
MTDEVLQLQNEVKELELELLAEKSKAKALLLEIEQKKIFLVKL